MVEIVCVSWDSSSIVAMSGSSTAQVTVHTALQGTSGCTLAPAVHSYPTRTTHLVGRNRCAPLVAPVLHTHHQLLS